MGLFDAIEIAGSGMNAERVSMDVTAENLANAQSTTSASGQPYQRQVVELATVSPSSNFYDTTADQLVYDPGNPSANKQGYVKTPNVSTVTEMVNLIDESNSYESDVTAMQTAKDMFTSALGVLK
jgi:flagellar basal-body rod protein FlgC